MVETLDCAESLRHVDVTDRSVFRATLASTLVKRAEHRAAFDSLFDTYFALQREATNVATTLDRPGGPVRGEGGEGEAEPPSTDLLKALQATQPPVKPKLSP